MPPNSKVRGITSATSFVFGSNPVTESRVSIQMRFSPLPSSRASGIEIVASALTVLPAGRLDAGPLAAPPDSEADGSVGTEIGDDGVAGAPHAATSASAVSATNCNAERIRGHLRVDVAPVR